MGLDCCDIQFGYRVPVLRGVNASFAPGRIAVIVGPNGCGKTTLLRIMLGLATPDKGDCRLDHTNVQTIPPRLRARRMAYIPHRPSIEYAYTVRQFVGLGQYGVRDVAIDRSIDAMELNLFADAPMASLSAGQAQRASIARTLAQVATSDPARCFLLADEPNNALDPKHVASLMQTVRNLVGQGMGAVITLHDLSLASQIADDVLVLSDQGQVAAFGRGAEVLTPANIEPVFSSGFETINTGTRKVLLPKPGTTSALDLY